MNFYHLICYMLKISKLTDYALVILSQMKEYHVFSAQNLSQLTLVPLATTNKVLKLLTKAGICKSKSGKMGGFYLSRQKKYISVLDTIYAIEGRPTSFIACSSDTQSCQLLPHCKISSKMNLLDKEISQLLSQKFISDLS